METELLQTELELRGKSSDPDPFDDEHMTLRWLCDGREDWEWWNAQPKYQRRAWINEWQLRYDQAQATGSRIMPSGLALALREDQFQQTKKLVEKWAVEIRAAYLAGQPCPIRVLNETLDGWKLDWAASMAFDSAYQSKGEQ